MLSARALARKYDYVADALPDSALAVICSPVRKFGFWVVTAVVCLAPQLLSAGDYDNLVLEQVKQMPTGGHYSVSHFARFDCSHRHTLSLGNSSSSLPGRVFVRA